MTKEKLKEDYEKFASRPDIFDVWTAHSTDAVFDWFYSKLEEQDRESRREILKGIETYWNDNNYDEISSGGLIKHLGLDLKQDEN